MPYSKLIFVSLFWELTLALSITDVDESKSTFRVSTLGAKGKSSESELKYLYTIPHSPTITPT